LEDNKLGNEEEDYQQADILKFVNGVLRLSPLEFDKLHKFY